MLYGNYCYIFTENFPQKFSVYTNPNYYYYYFQVHGENFIVLSLN